MILKAGMKITFKDQGMDKEAIGYFQAFANAGVRLDSEPTCIVLLPDGTLKLVDLSVLKVFENDHLREFVDELQRMW